MRSQFLFATAFFSCLVATACTKGTSDPNHFNQGGNSGSGGGTTTGGNGGGTTSSTTSSTTVTPDPGCIPTDMKEPVGDKCGIFVSSSKGADTAPGTKAEPVATLGKAIELAAGGSQPVYMCAETFMGPVEVSASALVYGGLDCAGDWGYVGQDTKTDLTSPTDTVPLTVRGDVNLEIHDVVVQSVDATKPGGSSIAVAVVSGTASLDMVNCAVEAGAGAAGTSGVSFSTPAADGAKGANGGEACSANTVIAGDPPVNRCGDIDSAGGIGGVGSATSGTAGGAGEPFVVDNKGDGPQGASSCKNGAAGPPGATGIPGDGATGVGSLDKNGFLGLAGAEGMPGLTAQGGGGGGGEKGGTTACATKPGTGGASGGTGGSGGCGGQGGKGGNPGGASIGILSLGAQLKFTTTTITTAAGGTGGSGGQGQTGGIGLGGGSGGTVPVGVLLNAGCAGGPGGLGGQGGRGGGGLGGHSVGIAHTGDAPDMTGATITTGSPGEGGAGDGPTGKADNGSGQKTQKFEP